MARALQQRTLIGRFGPLPVMFAGIAAMVASPLILALALHAGTAYAPTVLVAFILLGLGGGMAFVTLMGVALADVPPADRRRAPRPRPRRPLPGLATAVGGVR